MSTNTQENRNLIPWRKRASFRVGRTRKQRQGQYRQQMNALVLTLMATVIAGGLIVLFNYREAGSTKTVNCDEFPEYCVPLAGGYAEYSQIEAADSRELNEPSEGAPGVVRYVSDLGIPTIGDPTAPIHFVTVSDFSCSHCQTFHRGELKAFLESEVLTGRATVGFAMLTGVGGIYSQNAANAALCAGEYGAFWEMSDELFRLGSSMGPTSAFDPSRIRESADDMGLDGDAIISCANARQYNGALANFSLFANDYGITSTPTVMFSIGDSGEWQRAPSRSYQTLVDLVDAAHRAP